MQRDSIILELGEWSWLGLFPQVSIIISGLYALPDLPSTSVAIIVMQ